MCSHRRSNNWDHKRMISTLHIDRPAVTLTLECYYPGNQANPPLHLRCSTSTYFRLNLHRVYDQMKAAPTRVQTFARFLQQVCRLSRWVHLTALSHSQTHRFTLMEANINLPRLFCYWSRWRSANPRGCTSLVISPSFYPSLFCWGCCIQHTCKQHICIFLLVFCVGNFSQSQ